MVTEFTLTRVAIYARVSTSEQAENGTSIENQLEQLRIYCGAQNWEIIQEYVDPGFSGKDDNRPELQRMVASAKAGLFDKVVVYKLDRLCRNLRLLLGLKEDFALAGVGITSIKESIDTSSMTGRMTFQILGMVSEWERETIIERTKSGRIARLKQGRWAGGTVSFGYEWDKETSSFQVVEEEAQIIREIFSLYSNGKSLNEVARMLNQERARTRSGKGKGWRSMAVRGILVNPMYRGEMVMNRNAQIYDLDKLDETAKSKLITIKVPAIIDDKQFEAAQSHLSTNKRIKPKSQTIWLLQGLLTCGICGYSFKAAHSHKARYYLCRGTFRENHVDGSPRCPQRTINANWLEKELWSRIEAVINDPNKLAPLLDDSIKQMQNREKELSLRLIPVESQLASVSLQKSKLADEWVKTNMDSAKYQELQSNLNKEEIRLMAIKSSIDPAALEELEQARRMLKFWQEEVRDMRNWNTENEDGTMTSIVKSPHEAAFRMVGYEDMKLSQIMGFPTYKRELLDKLQVRLIAFEDRIEVKAIFEIEPIDFPEHRSHSHLEGECY